MGINRTTVDKGFAILRAISRDAKFAAEAGDDYTDAIESNVLTYNEMGELMAALLSYHAGTSFEDDAFDLIANMVEEYLRSE